jgi:hypothetical protein
MLTIGVDAHKRIHFALALAETGTVLDHWSGPNRRAHGYRAADVS